MNENLKELREISLRSGNEKFYFGWKCCSNSLEVFFISALGL